MNKLLCLGLGIISSLAMISQKAVYDHPLIQKVSKVDGIPLVQYHHDLETNQISHSKSSAGETEVIFLGSSGNIYTALLPGNNQVSYNPALDAVSFVHRRNDAAPLNGVMEFDYSIDGGASWEVNQGPLSPNFANGTETGIGGGLRYPNGVLWAPEGSTNTDDAYIFSNGPTLDSDAVLGLTYLR